jgi:hypothetical protein
MLGSKYLLASVLAGAVALGGLAQAQGNRAPDIVEALPTPGWWGGQVDDLEAALKVAGDWCRSVEDAGRFGTARSWALSDGTWAIGAAVASNPENARERRELQDTLRMKANDRALRGLAICSLESEQFGSMAVEGALYHFEASAIRAELSQAPRTKAYTTDSGLAYTISLVSGADVLSLELKGIEEMGLASLAAQGLLVQAAEGPGAIAKLIEKALGLDSSPPTIEVAADRCAIDGDAAAAAIVFEAAGAITLDIDGDSLERWAKLASLAGAKDTLVATLAKAGDQNSRVDILERHLREQGLSGLNLVIHDRRQPAILFVLANRADNGLDLRNAFEALRSPSGGVREPGLSIRLTGDVGVADSSHFDPFRAGADVQVPGEHPAWLLVRSAESMDRRLEQSGSRLRVESKERTAVEEVIHRAAIGRAAALNLWPEMSNGAVATAASSAGIRDAAVWTVYLGDDQWQVDFTLEIDDLLREGSGREPFKAATTLGAGMESHRAAMDTAITRCMGKASSEREAQMLLHLSLERGSLERGEDEGSIFTGTKPWVRLPIEVHLDVTVDGVTERLSRSGWSRKVFGGHDIEPFVTSAAGELLALLLEGLPRAAAHALDAPSLLLVTGSSLESMDVLLAAARGFGSVTIVAPVGEEHEPEDAFVKLFWPGGAVGLQRALDTMSEQTGWSGLSSLRFEPAVPNVPTPKK